MTAAAPSLLRLTRRLPAWLAALALLLRIALPGLHEHGHHGHWHGDAQAACCHAEPAPACPCGHDHRPPPLVASAATAPAGPCHACALELANPGGDVPVVVAIPARRAARAPPFRAARTARERLRCHRHRARAPPGPTPARR